MSVCATHDQVFISGVMFMAMATAQVSSLHSQVASGGSRVVSRFPRKPPFEIDLNPGQVVLGVKSNKQKNNSGG